MVLPLLIGGAAVGITGSILERQAAKRRRRRATIYAQGLLSEQQRDALKRLELTEKGVEAERESFDRAEKLTSTRARAAKRQALDRQKEIAASLQARFGGSSQSTAYQNALSGLSARSARELADVDASFAGILSNLALGRGRAEVGAQERLGVATSRYSGAKQNYLSALAGIAQDRGPGAFDTISAGLAGANALGGLGGLLGGGGGGGLSPAQQYARDYPAPPGGLGYYAPFVR